MMKSERKNETSSSQSHLLFSKQEQKFTDNVLLDKALALLYEAYPDEAIKDSDDLCRFRETISAQLKELKEKGVNEKERSNVMSLINDLEQELRDMVEFGLK